MPCSFWPTQRGRLCRFFNVPILLMTLLLSAANARPAAEDPILVIDPQGHSAMIRDVMFTPDGRRLISVSDDKTIRLWDVESGELLKTLRGQVGKGHEGKLFAGALSPDGTTLAVGGYLKNDEIRLINIETGEQTGLFKGHTNVIHALAFSPDSQWLASGSGDDTVRIWEVGKSGTVKEKSGAAAVLEGHTDSVYGVAFSPDGRKVVSASDDNLVILWNWPDQKIIKKLDKHTDDVNAVAWSPDGRHIVSGGFDDKILLWDGRGNFIKEIDEVSENIFTISFSSNSKKIIFSGFLGKITYVYIVPSGQKISTFTRHDNTVLASAFYGSHLIATAGGNDNDIYLWNADSAEVKTHIVGKGKCVWAAAFGPGLQVAFGKSYSYVDDSSRGPLEKSFDFSKMSLERETPQPGPFTRTRPTYLGNTLKYLNDYELQISPGTTIKNDRRTDGWIRCYTFTAGGSVVVGSDFSLKLFGSDGTFIREFVGHTGAVWAVSPSRDGRILASASLDQTVRLWNINSGELLACLFVTVDNEWICWTPQGHYAASAGGERYIGWHVNRGPDRAADYYPAYSFRRQYHKPELVRRTIELFSFDRALAEYNKTSGTKIKAAALPPTLPPQVQWLKPVTYSQKTDTAALRILARIVSEQEITDYKILVDGRTAASKNDIRVLDDASASQKTIEYLLPLKAGRNRITIFAAHSRASATSTERLVIFEDVDYMKPNLYVVAIGISDYDKKDIGLEYADDDARAIGPLFAAQKGRLFKHVYTRSLYNAQASRVNIIEALEWLEKKVSQKDIALVFIAAHGYNERGSYYVLPCDGKPDSLRSTAVNWDDFADILGSLPGRVLLFLDTCHSGGFDPDALERFRGSAIDNTEAVRELASEENGVVVMAASTARERSIERREWGHGAFTKAIIEGLKQRQADLNGDGIVYVTELHTYVCERVKELTNGKQHPTTQRPPGISRFPIFQLL